MRIEESINYFLHDFKSSLNKSKEFELIEGSTAIIGMGGSGIAGKIIHSIDPNVKVFSDYASNVNLTNIDNLILVSYSGNTEEVLSYIHNKNIKFIITSGGKLLQFAKEKSIPYVLLKSNYQPRAALPMILPILSKLTSKRAFERIKKDIEQFTPKLFNISLEEPLVIYGYEIYKGIAYRWKTQLNENAKFMAFYNEIPESNHNEIEVINNIICVGKAKHERIKKRIQFLINEFNVYYIDEENLINLIYMGDVLSLNLSKKDPNKLYYIPKLKEFLKGL